MSLALPPDALLAKAMSHPLRAKMLHVLRTRTASPSELADELGEDLGRTSYHVRYLFADLGLLELVRTEPVRGAMEHFYRARPLPVAAEMGVQSWIGVVDEDALQAVQGVISQALAQLEEISTAAQRRVEERRGDPPYFPYAVSVHFGRA